MYQPPRQFNMPRIRRGARMRFYLCNSRVLCPSPSILPPSPADTRPAWVFAGWCFSCPLVPDTSASYPIVYINLIQPIGGADQPFYLLQYLKPQARATSAPITFSIWRFLPNFTFICQRSGQNCKNAPSEKKMRDNWIAWIIWIGQLDMACFREIWYSV